MQPFALLVAAILLAMFVQHNEKPNKKRRVRKITSRCSNVKARTHKMTKKRAFISFDYDHDEDLRVLLVGQARHPDTPFDLADWSVKEHISGDWKEKVRSRIRSVDVMIVICGEFTHQATGVSAELAIAREEKIPYFLLWGRKEKSCTKPAAAIPSDKIYSWTWENLGALTRGER